MARHYLIERILPAYEVHLIAGPSGAGKTTLLFQMLDDWRQGKPVFGYPTHPCPFIYISADRSVETTRETIKRAGATVEDTQMFSMVDKKWRWQRDLDSLFAFCAHLEKLVSQKHDVLLVIDGFQSLTPIGRLNDYDVVARMMVRLTKFCCEQKITIIGSCHATKVKEGERIINPRQYVLGSVAWAGFSETVIIMESPNPRDTEDPERKVMVFPRNSPAMDIRMRFDKGGKLVEPDDEIAEAALDIQLDRIPAGSQFDTGTAIDWGAAANLKRRTVEAWLTRKVRAGVITRLGKGLYQKAFAV